MNDYDEFEKKTKKSKIKIPEAFHQEVKEYVGLQLSDEDDKYIGQTFNPIVRNGERSLRPRHESDQGGIR
jgi:hypothetical protein